ncbi:MAG: lysophospholipid acyltransferase family protein [Deltaproteobacteria bacterium]|nr:lysophospholipid acyltransferase family protein [Deltaproteobacteria bacterium]
MTKKKGFDIPATWNDQAIVYAFQSASRLFNLLPTDNAYQLGVRLIRLWISLDRNHHRIINKNLELALGLTPNSPESKKLRAEILEQLGFNLCEFFLLQKTANRQRLLQNLKINGLEHLLQAEREGRGGIIISAHLGNWELAGGLSKYLREPIATVAKPFKNSPNLYKIIEKTRREIGFLPLNKSGSATTLARTLKQGKIIALLVDQRVRRRFRIWSPFFGHLVPTIPSPAILARLSGSPIIPAFTYRERPLHHHIVIEKPIFVPKTGDSQVTIAEYTERLNRLMEEHIRRHPAQWFWPHDRWRKIRSSTM